MRRGIASSDLLLDRFLTTRRPGTSRSTRRRRRRSSSCSTARTSSSTRPTGSGKSLVASALHFASLARGQRSVYTCPIKALVNEKWMALCREFGPENVGLSTGDATVNRDAPILCCTAEILANIALARGRRRRVDDVVMDEFHYYADRDRGVAWQVPLLTLPQARFLLMSATLGDTTLLRGGADRAQRPADGDGEVDRAARAARVRLLRDPARADAREARRRGQGAGLRRPLHAGGRGRQRAGLHEPQPLHARGEGARSRRRSPASAFTSPYGQDIRKWLRHGIGLHHAGLLPKYRVLVEQLAQKGLLKVICGTDTLGVGINVPIRTVLFTRLCKYDGAEDGASSARATSTRSPGAPGARASTTAASSSSQAPEHVIENLRLEREGGEATARRSSSASRPSTTSSTGTSKTFKRLIGAPPERLTSRFQVSHGMLLNVLSRARRRLPRDAAADPRLPRAASARSRRTATRAWQLFRALRRRGRSWSSSRGRADGRQAAGQRRSAGRLLDGPGALALPARDDPAARPRVAGPTRSTC